MAGPEQCAIDRLGGPGDIVLAIRGALDRDSADRVHDELVAAWDVHQLPLVLDLEDVTYLDSTVLRVLLVTRRALLLDGGSLTIAGASPPVRRFLDLTGTTDLF